MHSRPVPVCCGVTSNRCLGVQLLWPFSDIREGLLLWRIAGSKGALQSSIWWTVSCPSVERPLWIGRYDGCAQRDDRRQPNQMSVDDFLCLVPSTRRPRCVSLSYRRAARRDLAFCAGSLR